MMKSNFVVLSGFFLFFCFWSLEVLRAWSVDIKMNLCFYWDTMKIIFNVPGSFRYDELLSKQHL